MITMSEKLTVGCLGTGYFAQYHYSAWNRNPAVVLKASADHDIEKARASQSELHFSSLSAMLESTRLDILDIITPPASHYGAIEQAVEHSLKAIICQKPFCRSKKEAVRATDLAAAANIPLVIHENFRFQPWHRCLKHVLNVGLIGNPLQFMFRLRTGDGQGANAYLDRQPYFRKMPRLLIHETGVHYIDTFRYLFGPIKSVYADLRTLNPAIMGEDAGQILFEHDNGIRSLFDGNRLLDHATKDPRLTFGEGLLEGTQGVVTLDGTGRVKCRRFGKTVQSTLLEGQNWTGFAGDCVYALQDHVVSAVLYGTKLENTAAEYLPVLDLVDSIYQSAASGKKIEIANASDG